MTDAEKLEEIKRLCVSLNEGGETLETMDLFQVVFAMGYLQGRVSKEALQ